jgi:hypothetical protein
MLTSRRCFEYGRGVNQRDASDGSSHISQTLQSFGFFSGAIHPIAIVDENNDIFAGLGCDGCMRDDHSLSKIFRRVHASGIWDAADSLDCDR